jgi:hypothetical protein
MNYKGQGAIEYLLIIGAAILVVAIVIIAVTGALGQGTTQGNQANKDQNAQNVKLACMADCNAAGADCGTVAAPLACAQLQPATCTRAGSGASPNNCVRK